MLKISEMRTGARRNLELCKVLVPIAQIVNQGIILGFIPVLKFRKMCSRNKTNFVRTYKVEMSSESFLSNTRKTFSVNSNVKSKIWLKNKIYISGFKMYNKKSGSRKFQALFRELITWDLELILEPRKKKHP